MNPIDKIIPNLSNVKQRGSKYRANCPCKEHRQDPSLSVEELPDGKVIMKCWSGCPTDEVLMSLGLNFNDLFVDDGQPYKRDYSDQIEHERLTLAFIREDGINDSNRERAELALHRIKAMEAI